MAHDRRQTRRVVTYRATTVESGEPHEVEYDAVADALHFACSDLLKGRRQPIEIVEDGVRIFDADAIREECERKREEQKAEHGIG